MHCGMFCIPKPYCTLYDIFLHDVHKQQHFLASWTLALCLAASCRVQMHCASSIIAWHHCMASPADAEVFLDSTWCPSTPLDGRGLVTWPRHHVTFLMTWQLFLLAVMVIVTQIHNTGLVSSVSSMVAPLTRWYWVRIPVGLALHLHITSSSCV